MPPGGRPSVGPEARRRREWEAWQAQNRFEELETDDDLYGAPPDPRHAPDRLRFTGYDTGTGRQDYYDDLAYGDDYDMADEYDDGHGGTRWQLEMKEREEEAASRAMRRMNRARLRGDPNCPLSKEEIDALEKRQLIPRTQERETQASTAPTKAGISAKGKKGANAAVRTASAPTAKPKGKLGFTRTPPVSESPSRRSSGQGAELTLAGAASPSKRAGPRSTSGPVARQQPAMPDPRDYRPPSSRGSPGPQDPDVGPRPRSSSAAQYYGNPYATYGYGYPPMPAPAGAPSYPSYPQRRHISGPAAVSYPPQGAPRSATRSRREREVIVISSDDEGTEDESEDDEGVALDPVPESTGSGYVNPSRAPPPRARRGQR